MKKAVQLCSLDVPFKKKGAGHVDCILTTGVKTNAKNITVPFAQN